MGLLWGKVARIVTQVVTSSIRRSNDELVDFGTN